MLYEYQAVYQFCPYDTGGRISEIVGRWRVVGGGWQVEGGRWQVVGGHDYVWRYPACDTSRVPCPVSQFTFTPHHQALPAARCPLPAAPLVHGIGTRVAIPDYLLGRAFHTGKSPKFR
jgi:hypothetical protein